MSVEIKRQEVIIIDFSSCPDEIKSVIKTQYNFHRDSYLEYLSELTPCENETWRDVLSMDRIQRYWNNQKSTNDYQGSLEDLF